MWAIGCEEGESISCVARSRQCGYRARATRDAYGTDGGKRKKVIALRRGLAKGQLSPDRKGAQKSAAMCPMKSIGLCFDADNMLADLKTQPVGAFGRTNVECFRLTFDSIIRVERDRTNQNLIV